MSLGAGDRFGFREDRRVPAVEAWRDIDRAVARWALAHGGSALLALVAGWASHAEGQGDSALFLDRGNRHGMAPLEDAAIAALADEGLVGLPEDEASGRVHPFVLDGAAFYLRRNFRHELAVAQALRARRGEPTHSSGIEDEALRTLFGGSWREEEAPQRAAVRAALGRRLCVLTGGPGTGKTTTVLRMLLAIVRDFEAGHGRAPVIRAAAPTGKAAQRLSDALRAGTEAVAPDWQPCLAPVLAAEAGTLHRLLGSRGPAGYRHHADHRLPLDVLVVDEASMVDLALLRALLDALPEAACLVLVGDADQLTSVGTGSVLMDIVAALEADPQGDLVRLGHCFRADGGLAEVNAAVRSGDPAAFSRAFEAAAAGGRAVHHRLAGARQLAPRLRAWAEGIGASLAASGAFDTLAEDEHARQLACLRALRSRQLLCALREGGFGAIEANRQIEAWLRQHPALAGDPPDAWAWYPGRAVLVTRNDPATGLFNGDIGLCLRLRGADGQARLQVVFEPLPDARRADDGATAPRHFDPNTLPPHQGAFALTVHKSQGSEYAHVAVLLPPEAEHPLLSRQLLYTGLSRAREGIELWASDASLSAALGKAVGRQGRLGVRIVGA